MNFISKTAVATAVLALASLAGNAKAAEQGHYITSNAVDKCQAFTPGPSNTIRNRVSGAENVGSTPIAVACVFELDEVYAAGSVTVDDVTVYTYNNGSATGSAATVSCTLLPGNYQSGFGTATTRTGTPPPSGNASIQFSALALDAYALGVNCTVPANVVISHLVLRYRNDAA